MSHTQASNTLRSAHLRYTARAMDECLRDAIKHHSAKAARPPRRLLEAAQSFLRTALEAGSVQASRDPSIGIANYRIAASAIRGSGLTDPALGDLTQPMKEHLKLLDTLSAGKRLAQIDPRSLKQLQSFFAALFRVAEARSYSAAINEADDERPFRLSTKR